MIREGISVGIKEERKKQMKFVQDKNSGHKIFKRKPHIENISQKNMWMKKNRTFFI